jgi:hypothetical protein
MNDREKVKAAVEWLVKIEHHYMYDAAHGKTILELLRPVAEGKSVIAHIMPTEKCGAMILCAT